MKAFVSIARFDHPSAERELMRLSTDQSSSPSVLARVDPALAALALTQGKLAAGAQYGAAALAIAEERQQPGDYLALSTQLARIDLLYRNQPAIALERVSAALSRHPLATLDPLDRPYSALARFYAEAGKPDEARRLLAEYQRIVPAGVRRADAEEHGAEGAVALADGRTQEAIAGFRSWHDESGCEACGLFGIATAYQKANRPDSAIAYYERSANVHAMDRIYGDAFTLAAAYQRLGELYEARGDRAKALSYYGRFVALWKTADPELQPIVRDVRARITRLSVER
jgi:tetratricopeptide (TPR) repeat protein